MSSRPLSVGGGEGYQIMSELVAGVNHVRVHVALITSEYTWWSESISGKFRYLCGRRV